MHVNKDSGDLSTETAIRGSASSPCECSAVKRTNSLYFGVACNSAECIPLPATSRSFRIATISIYSGVIDYCYRLIQASLSSIFSSFDPSLFYLFVLSIRKRNVFDPRARKCTCLLYPQIASFHFVNLSLSAIFFNRLSPLPSIQCHHTHMINKINIQADIITISNRIRTFNDSSKLINRHREAFY